MAKPRRQGSAVGRFLWHVRFLRNCVTHYDTFSPNGCKDVSGLCEAFIRKIYCFKGTVNLSDADYSADKLRYVIVKFCLSLIYDISAYKMFLIFQKNWKNFLFLLWHHKRHRFFICNSIWHRFWAIMAQCFFDWAKYWNFGSDCIRFFAKQKKPSHRQHK